MRQITLLRITRRKHQNERNFISIVGGSRYDRCPQMFVQVLKRCALWTWNILGLCWKEFHMDRPFWIRDFHETLAVFGTHVNARKFAKRSEGFLENSYCHNKYVTSVVSCLSYKISHPFCVVQYQPHSHLLQLAPTLRSFELGIWICEFVDLTPVILLVQWVIKRFFKATIVEESVFLSFKSTFHESKWLDITRVLPALTCILKSERTDCARKKFRQQFAVACCAKRLTTFARLTGSWT